MIPTQKETEELAFKVTKANSLKAEPLKKKQSTKEMLEELGIEVVE